jgi:small-conductance mechanosensitive channel
MDDLSEIRSALDQVNYYLQQRPSSKIETGVLPDSPLYGQETRTLEHVQSQLSLAIKRLHQHSRNNDPKLVELRRYARKLQREIKESFERAGTVNVHELLAATSEKIHEYHEMTEFPQDYGYYEAEFQPSVADGLQSFVALFSIVAAYVQLRKRRK